MKRLVIWWCIVLLVLSTLTVSAAEADSIAGNWTVSFNGYPGAMEIREGNGDYSGRFNLQAHGNWEEMLDLRVEGNRISFRRAHADQRYSGKITGSATSGNFTQGGSGNYSWKAEH